MFPHFQVRLQAEAVAPGTKLANPLLAEAKMALIVFDSATMSSMSLTIGMGYMGPSFDDSREEEEDAGPPWMGFGLAAHGSVGPPPPMKPPCPPSAEASTQPSALSTTSASMFFSAIIFDHR